MISATPYQPNFENDVYARSYLSLFTDLNRFHDSQNININYEEYKSGYTLYAIDLTPDSASGECHTSINRTGCRISQFRYENSHSFRTSELALESMSEKGFAYPLICMRTRADPSRAKVLKKSKFLTSVTLKLIKKNGSQGS
ncbi:uncharacterized protein F54H12.2 [Trichonephila clavipes]|nr:uncharacterized protein F54H12.2 [Trichonephila clavipes]